MIHYVLITASSSYSFPSLRFVRTFIGTVPFWELEIKQTIRQLYPHPCPRIVSWLWIAISFDSLLIYYYFWHIRFPRQSLLLYLWSFRILAFGFLRYWEWRLRGMNTPTRTWSHPRWAVRKTRTRTNDNNKRTGISAVVSSIAAGKNTTTEDGETTQQPRTTDHRPNIDTNGSIPRWGFREHN